MARFVDTDSFIREHIDFAFKFEIGCVYKTQHVDNFTNEYTNEEISTVKILDVKGDWKNGRYIVTDKGTFELDVCYTDFGFYEFFRMWVAPINPIWQQYGYKAFSAEVYAW